MLPSISYVKNNEADRILSMGIKYTATKEDPLYSLFSQKTQLVIIEKIQVSPVLNQISPGLREV